MKERKKLPMRKPTIEEFYEEVKKVAASLSKTFFSANIDRCSLCGLKYTAYISGYGFKSGSSVSAVLLQFKQPFKNSINNQVKELSQDGLPF